MKVCVSFLGALALLCTVSACTSSSKRNVVVVTDASMRVGMPPAEVVALFGEPVDVYPMDFGQDTGNAWSGLVYEYEGRDNPRFADISEPYKYRLVFAIVGGDTLLNHWDLGDVGDGR